MELSQVKHHIRAIQLESTVEQQKGDGRRVKCLGNNHRPNKEKGLGTHSDY